MQPNVDQAVLEALGLEATGSKMVAHGGSSFASTYKLTASKDGHEFAYFMKTGVGAEAETMFRGLRSAFLSQLRQDVRSLT